MLDLASFIKTAGYLGVGAVVFTESGLLIGMFLPGDSFLFTAGFLASQGYLDIAPLALVAFVAAVLGDNLGYWLGRKFGRAVFSRSGSLFFDPARISDAEAFYRKHGPKTIVIARFMPVVRTIAPVLAGVGSMHRSTFMAYNMLGGLLWGIGLTVAGYVLGATVPGVDRYLVPIIALIMLTSVAPGLWQFLREPAKRRAAVDQLKGLLRRNRSTRSQ